jgi:hypothetical protein
VTAEKLPVLAPPVKRKPTVRPPVVNWFPFRSFAVRVTAMLELDVTVDEAVVT